MPNIKSAKKRVIVNNNRAKRNKSMNSALKTAIKKANSAPLRKIDQATAKGLLHKNNAARKKSALVKKLNKA